MVEKTETETNEESKQAEDFQELEPNVSMVSKSS